MSEDKTARGYKRLSDVSDTSLQRQQRRIEQYAEENDLELEFVYDEGQKASGWDSNREQYQQMLADAEAGEFDVLVVADGSRLGRDKKERLRTFLDLDDWDVEFHVPGRGYVDPDEPIDLLEEVFKATSDDDGKRSEIERLNEANQERREDGKWVSGEPFGLQYDDEKDYLIADPDEFEVVMNLLADRDEGATYDELVEKYGVAKGTVKSIVKDRREVYEAVEDGAKVGYQYSIIRPEVAADGGSD